MVNERKTENIVRAHFKQFADQIIIEEQQSDSPKIQKLLQTASKKGHGVGKPEFIIQISAHPDLLIVVECKADTAKHESTTTHQYSTYAVDGVLCYASYLSKSYDVLAIAVSGEEKQSLKVSHFLHLCNQQKATAIFGDHLLSINHYVNGYVNSPAKFRQDYKALSAFTKQLNQKLHTYKILESQRSLLISAVLMALENPAFKKSYTAHKKPANLANALTQTLVDELESAHITGKRLDNLRTQFSFITTDTSLSKKENLLKELIDDIDENINIFMKTHKYFDVLGQLYIEFLRYANSDKGLGIVLTPPHITDFFAALAQVDKNTIVYDNCSGTGGFLISAMKSMIADAKGDQAKIKAIKSHQLIGVEYQAHIFALAVSNMYIHQDGKTNIINGNCFDEAIIRQVKAQKPTVGFLNPPYKDKKNDIEELAFVLNNLETLTYGATCIAIIPMSAVLAKQGAKLALKKRLLAQHTLEAVISMPEDLFHNSKVSPVTVVTIFTAHKPHPKQQKTWLGYLRDDNFVKTKDRGRVDLHETWEDIKNEWLTLYFNRESQKNVSLSRQLSPSDEWCIAPYLVADYDQITEATFIQKVQQYLAFRLLHNLLGLSIHIPKERPTKKDLLPLSALFDVYNGIPSSNIDIVATAQSKHHIRYVRPSQTYPGSIAGYLNKKAIAAHYIYPADTLYVATDGQGSHTYAYVSSFEFVPNSNVAVLLPKQPMTLQEKIYYALCITQNRYKFSYGRKPKGERLKNILLPATSPKYIYKDVFSKVFAHWKKIVQ